MATDPAALIIPMDLSKRLIGNQILEMKVNYMFADNTVQLQFVQVVRPDSNKGEWIIQYEGEVSYVGPSLYKLLSCLCYDRPSPNYYPDMVPLDPHPMNSYWTPGVNMPVEILSYLIYVPIKKKNHHHHLPSLQRLFRTTIRRKNQQRRRENGRYRMLPRQMQSDPNQREDVKIAEHHHLHKPMLLQPLLQ